MSNGGWGVLLRASHAGRGDYAKVSAGRGRQARRPGFELRGVIPGQPLRGPRLRLGNWGDRALSYQASRNKAAWEHRAYEFWVQSTGPPDQVARDMLDDPTRWLRRHLHVLGDVRGRRVLHPLGSNGRKGIPLAILGAEVTIIDISEENKRYALDVARAAGVDIEYIVADYGE